MFLSSAALSAPLSQPLAGTGATPVTAAEQVRLVCDQNGQCYRSRGRRYVQRGYYGGRQGYGYNRGYGGQGYYGGGPSIGLSFGNRGW
jgi:hypothetical protein